MQDILSIPKKIMNNTFFSIISSVMLAIYAARVTHFHVPNFTYNFLDNNISRFVTLLVFTYVATENFALGLLLCMCYLLTLISLEKQHGFDIVTESFHNFYNKIPISEKKCIHADKKEHFTSLVSVNESLED
tara:strand:- start:405 stop:800 length:396 start_codon:yes stop_codon:yes gene_type:complete